MLLLASLAFIGSQHLPGPAQSIAGCAATAMEGGWSGGRRGTPLNGFFCC